MRGEVLIIDEASGSGTISAVDGNRYSFSMSDMKFETPLRSGSRVDFQIEDGAARDIFVIAASGQAITPGDVQEDRLSMWGFFTRAVSKYYAKFSGRARRKEYWSFTLFYAIAIIIAVMISGGIDGALKHTDPIIMIVVLGIVMLFFILPSLSVLVRRLHDIGLSGWFALLLFLPYVGGIALFVMCVLPTEAGRNKYGPAPLARLQ